MNIKEIHFLLNKYGISPRYAQGQNFLLDNSVIESAVAAANITKDDTILEVGPGFGVLTTALADIAGQVIAIEQDREIMKAMHTLERQYPNLKVINEDIRITKLEAAGLQDGKYKFVSNLPYSISSWVLRQFTEYAPKPTLMVIMLQKEVAERVAAKPGKMSVLANAVQLFGEPEIVRNVGKQSFYPVPEVESAILKITMRETPLSKDPASLMRIVKAGFASRRKQLHNNLESGLQLRPSEAKAVLEDIGLSAGIRPQELSVTDWEALRIALHL